LKTTTKTMPRRTVVRWKHIGQMAKERNQALGFWLCAAANSRTSTARYSGPRRFASVRQCGEPSRSNGRPRKRYHGIIAASATLATIRPAAVSGPASTIARLAAKITA
jgi:hypothetical protein